MQPQGNPPVISAGSHPAPRNAPWYALGVALAIAVGVLGYPRFRDLQVARAAAPVSHEPWLALEVKRHEDDLRLTWKQDSPAVNNAREGVLSIRDGDSPSHDLHLAPEQLRKGSILYSPTHAYVQFQLAITAPDNTSSKDTVLALTQGKAAPFSSIPLGEPMRVALIPPRARVGSAAVRAADAPEPGPPAHDAPAPQAGEARAKPPEAALHKTQPHADPPAYVEARAIHEARPDLPADIRLLLTSEVEVRVRVRVDDSGHVVRADVLRPAVSVSSALERITREAARLWRFTPAMQGDRPVASEVVLVFCYTPEAAN